MSERRIATVHDYDELHAVLRARANELQVSRAQLDEAMKTLPDRYASKLLAPVPMKTLGRVSFGPMLQALGLALIVVEDPEAVARYADKQAKRNQSQVRASVRKLKIPKWLINRKRSAFMNDLRNKKLSPKQRSEIARAGGKARVRRRRERLRAERRKARDAAAAVAVG